MKRPKVTKFVGGSGLVRIGALGAAMMSLLSTIADPSLADTPVSEMFMPASVVGMPTDTKEVRAADVTGDGCDDLVSVAWAGKWFDDDGRHEGLHWPESALFQVL